MVSRLEIQVKGPTERYLYGGDLARLARCVTRIGLDNEEFARALIDAVKGMKEEIKANELRDEMIGFINSENQ